MNHPRAMDEPTPPTSGGFSRSPETVAAASSWRLAVSGGAQSPVLVPDLSAERRSAAFVACVSSALERTQRRWF